MNTLILKCFSELKTAKKFSSAATKATAIVTKALAPHSISTAITAINTSSFYSISTDASNHKAQKIFPLVVQYFTISGTQIKLLKLGDLKGETSEIIANFCIDSLKNLSDTKTRWLSLLPAIERFLKIFEGLKSFFF